MTRRARSPVLFWLFGIPVVAGFVEAVRRAWLCDDIFISLRTIQNLFQGHGLVFNAGERVEGYTHLLWVLLLSALHRLGFDLVGLVQVVGLVAFAALLATLLVRARQRGAAVPLAAVVVALHFDMQIWSSGGLETMAFTAVLLGGVLAAASGSPRRWDLAAALYALATLLRPEGALYSVAAAVFLLWRTRSLRPALRFGVLWLLLVVPSEVFRLAYYGDPLPNTFYAKSGGSANWQQGWWYLSLYFRIYAVLLLGVVAMGVVWWKALRPAPREHGAARDSDAALLASVTVLCNLVYVTRLGGDFMFARFFIPVTPLLLVVIEDAVVWARRRSLQLVAVGILSVGVVLARVPHGQLLPGRERVHGIVNEYNYYPEDYLNVLRHQGSVLGRALQGTAAGVGLLSGQDGMAYFGNLLYALEPHGLTDRELARKPITERGRPGHERTASLEDLLLRRVQFRMRYGFTVGLQMENQIRFDDLYGEIVYYDRDIMQQLQGRPGINFLDYPEFLRQQLSRLEGPNGRLAEYRRALLARAIPASVLEDIDQKAEQFRRQMQSTNLRPVVSARD